MRGSVAIINSEADAQKVGMTREDALKQATITVRHDKAEYPADYDKNLKPNDEGYIEPIYEYEEVVDDAALKRFGFTSTS
ncbi:hypothetical protein BZJ19_10010 [Salinivibrio proteolyticus]|uniref:hypothetical protein n=1 Tax=Salinivibrio proteolyticus TaxID=334715 RepID=UPI0009890B59|nr:hypothetical protein [Salinivibrio proteolyticus]OOF25046.1 hypothetical protein BZJ19_10010 [Salinivibrio proteolyticus]